MKNTTNPHQRQTTDFGNTPQFVLEAEESFSSDEKQEASLLRREMARALTEVGINPDPWLAQFDTHCRTLARKREAHRLTMERVLLKKRAQLIEALAAQNWSLKEVNQELKDLGVPNGFSAATADQIERIWLEYRKLRMIVI